MKNFTILSAMLLMALTIPANAKAGCINHYPRVRQFTQDTTGYAGKYQRTIHGDLFYIVFEVKDGNVSGTTLWDGHQVKLKHVADDKFIVDGMDWGVVFLRDKNKKVTQVLIMGTDYWVKVKE